MHEKEESRRVKQEDIAVRHGEPKCAAEDRIRLAGIAGFGAALADRINQSAIHQSLQAGRPISCSKGCGACCRHVVPVSIPEAFMLAELVDELPHNLRSVVISRFEAARTAVRNGGLGGTPLISRAMEYFGLAIPCPFLEEESCGIHEKRPSVCREYLVTTPPLYCAEPSISSIDFVTPTIRISECLSVLAGELLGGAPTVIPLIAALDWARQNPEYKVREWEKAPVLARLDCLVKQRNPGFPV